MTRQTELIEILDRYRLIRHGESPWRDQIPNGRDTYPVEIGDPADFGRKDRAGIDGDQRDWDVLGERIFAQSRQDEPPEEEVVETLAWYQPFHYYGHEWGIYIKEDAIEHIAARVKKVLGGGFPDSRETQQLSWVAVRMLYLHEAFHHKVESFATRLEISRHGQDVYDSYISSVYRPLLNTPDVLEEALACSEMHVWFRDEKSSHSHLRPEIKGAALKFLTDWIPKLPVGYSRGLDPGIEEELWLLLSQISEAHPAPVHNPENWKFASHMTRGLFSKIVPRIVVPVGATPVIPWLR